MSRSFAVPCEAVETFRAWSHTRESATGILYSGSYTQPALSERGGRGFSSLRTEERHVSISRRQMVHGNSNFSYKYLLSFPASYCHLGFKIHMSTSHNENLSPSRSFSSTQDIEELLLSFWYSRSLCGGAVELVENRTARIEIVDFRDATAWSYLKHSLTPGNTNLEIGILHTRRRGVQKTDK
ncbi:hypothetical protein Tco_1255280 [Tanacetum coccineum]